MLLWDSYICFHFCSIFRDSHQNLTRLVFVVPFFDCREQHGEFRFVYTAVCFKYEAFKPKPSKCHVRTKLIYEVFFLSHRGFILVTTVKTSYLNIICFKKSCNIKRKANTEPNCLLPNPSQQHPFIIPPRGMRRMSAGISLINFYSQVTCLRTNDDLTTW